MLTITTATLGIALFTALIYIGYLRHQRDELREEVALLDSEVVGDEGEEYITPHEFMNRVREELAAFEGDLQNGRERAICAEEYADAIHRMATYNFEEELTKMAYLGELPGYTAETFMARMQVVATEYARGCSNTIGEDPGTCQDCLSAGFRAALWAVLRYTPKD